MSLVLDAIAEFEIRSQRRPGLIGRIAHSVVHTFIKKAILKMGDPVVRATVHGVELLLPLSHDLPRHIAKFPYYDTVLPNLVRFLIQEARVARPLTIVDVGANIGDTVRMLDAAAGAGNISFICVAPDDVFLALLHRNSQGLAVEVHSFLAASRTEEINAAFQRNSGTAAVIAGAEPRRACALDDILLERHIDLVKIDTDGYELEVIRGLGRTLHGCSPLMFIEFSPRHLRRIGRIEPNLVLELLRSGGYPEGLVYDYRGHPMGLTYFSDTAINYLINYINVDPDFYVDILLAKDHELLCRFYEFDILRYGK
jgi:FkbM family methyltransferase